MYFCDNYALAVVFCVVTMLCWGSWGNTQKLAGKTWRYELFYWDYVVGLVLFSLALGLTAGSWGGGAWSFCANLRAASWGNLGSAFLGGVVFNAANLLLVAAIAVAGMSVAFPVGIGLALVLGVVVNYIGAPRGDAMLLLGGVGLIVMAMVCNAVASAISRPQGVAAKGVALAVVCGVAMAFFYRFVARAMDMDFAATAPRAGALTPYSAFFVFALGVFASNFIFNTFAMRHPASGEPARGREYFRGSMRVHSVGVLGGCVWGLGNALSLVAAGKAGAAVSYGLGQGATLVSALWGILVWREFKGAPRAAHALNAAMFALFLAGLASIVAAGDAQDGREKPVKVIFDTDMYTDFDDAGALACLHALADAGKCELLATVANTPNCLSVAMCEIVNSYYGRPDIPVGCVREIGVSGRDPNHRRLYADVAEKYAGWVRHANSSDAPDANAVYRRTLAAQPDGSVVVCSVGFLTNLRRLIETPPDDISPLDGKALVARKVARCVIMACKHPRGKEYNSKSDPESSRIALDEWPTPIVFVDFDFGRDCFAGRALAETAGGDNPVRDVFAKNLPGREEVARDPEGWGRKCYGMGGRSAWDEVAALVAVMGAAPRFGTERGTYRMVSADGENEWVPADGGENMRIVEREPKAEVGRVIDELMLRPPALRTGEARP